MTIPQSKVISVDPINPAPDMLWSAADVLVSGGLVVFPTETVYGIAAQYNNEPAIERLYDVKQRHRDQPFTIHISNTELIERLGCVLSGRAIALIRAFWPGPLTLLLPLADERATLGFRFPDHPVAVGLIDAAGGAVLAPSANLRGNPSPVTAAQAIEQVGNHVDMVLDAGQTGYGQDSTIVDLSADSIRLVRQGAISLDDITSLLQGE